MLIFQVKNVKIKLKNVTRRFDVLTSLLAVRNVKFLKELKFE